MKYIQMVQNYGNFSMVFGPVLSAGDAITPYNDLTVDDLTSYKFVMYVISEDGTINDMGIPGNWDDTLTIVSAGNGYYKLTGTPKESDLPAFTTVGVRTITLQDYNQVVPIILPYNMDIIVVSPTAYNEMLYGAGGYAELTYASVSGANIPTTLTTKFDSLSATTSTGFAQATVLANSNYNGIQSYLANTISGGIDQNIVLSNLIYNKVIKIGSISADIIDNGNELYCAGAIIKDIEVRDGNVYLAYRDPDDGMMKMFTVPFVQDIIVASGGDLV